MASLTDFLFNGQAPQSVTKYGTTTQNLPQWFSDFQQGIAVKGNALAAEPYEPYGAPRIAGFNADQNNAFAATRSGMGLEAGAIRTNMNNAAAAGANADALGDASPWLNQASQNSYDVVGNYMNPYTDAVVDRAMREGDYQKASKLNYEVIPGIETQLADAPGNIRQAQHGIHVGRQRDCRRGHRSPGPGQAGRQLPQAGASCR